MSGCMAAGWPPRLVQKRTLLSQDCHSWRSVCINRCATSSHFMSNLAKIDPEWDKKKFCCNAIIETPKGRRNKFDYNEKYGLFELGGLLPEGLSFPYDFGFIPKTRGDDGDPLDVMVLMEEPAHIGCLLQVRILGVLIAEQIEGKKKVSNNR